MNLMMFIACPVLLVYLLGGNTGIGFYIGVIAMLLANEEWRGRR